MKVNYLQNKKYKDKYIFKNIASIVLFSILFSSITPVFAIIPQSMSYTAVLRDAAGVPLVGSHDFKVRYYDASVAGILMYEEEFTSTTINTGGTFFLPLGTGSIVSGTFSSINFNSPIFITLNTKLNTASSYDGEMLPRIPLRSVPFALNSEKLDGRGVGGANGIVAYDASSSIQTNNLNASGSINILGNVNTIGTTTSTNIFSTLLNSFTGIFNNLFLNNVATGTATDSILVLDGITGQVKQVAASVVNFFTQNISGNILTTNSNGAISTSTIISSNNLQVTGSELSSTINGVVATTSIISLQGATGTQGISGLNGLDGATGTAGVNGIDGLDGAQGIQGLQGIQGNQGLAGTNGLDGAQGVQGLQGVAGVDGIDGAIGTQGIQGLTGATGTAFVTTNVASSTGNFLQNIVEGISSNIVSIIKNLTQSAVGNILTTNINGLIATSSIINNNNLSYSTTTNSLTSDVNGIISSVSLPTSENLFNTDLVATGNRFHSFVSFDLDITDIGSFNFKGNNNGYIGVGGPGFGSGYLMNGSSNSITALSSVTGFNTELITNTDGLEFYSTDQNSGQQTLFYSNKDNLGYRNIFSGFTQFDVSATSGQITFGSYPSNRNDSAVNALLTPTNFLYTGNAGELLSAPISALISTSSLSNIAYVNGGNTFGGNASIGLNDAFNLELKTGKQLILSGESIFSNLVDPLGNNYISLNVGDGGSNVNALTMTNTSAQIANFFGTENTSMTQSGGTLSLDYGNSSTTESASVRLINGGNIRFGFSGGNASGTVSYAFPRSVGLAGQVLTTDGVGQLSWTAAGLGTTTSSGWGLTGNTGTDGGLTNFIGTTDAQNLSFRTNNLEQLNLSQTGRINFTNPFENIFLNGGNETSVGNYNIGIGSQALQSNTNGGSNVAIGQNAMGFNTTGFSNVAVGQSALLFNTTGQTNTAVGQAAGLQSTGKDNVFLGYNSGAGQTSGYLNIAIGANAALPNTTAGNQLSIGNWIYGNNGLIGINNSAPTEYLDVVGNVKFSGALMPAGVSGNVGEVLLSQGLGVAPLWVSTSSLGISSGGPTSPITLQNTNSLFSSVISGGSGATIANNSNFFGFLTGANAINANNSNFIGERAGQNATDANNSNFFGLNAGFGAANANNSNFLGNSAGNQAANAEFSNFFGFEAGNGATNALVSNFIGRSAGTGALNSFSSNFFGTEAGFGATGASDSVFIGSSAGYNALTANNSIFIGLDAGRNDTVNNFASANSSILIGDFTGTGGFSDSIAIGKNAINTKTNQFLVGPSYSDFSFRGVNYTFPATQGATGTTLTNDGTGILSWVAGGAGTTTNNLSFSTTTNILSSNVNGVLATSSLSNIISPITVQNGSSLFSTGLVNSGVGSIAQKSIFLGQDSGNGATNAFQSNFLGSNAGYQASAAFDSNFLGDGAGISATNANRSNFLGIASGFEATNANNSNFFGPNAGNGAINAADSNFFGVQAGFGATDAANSTFMGSLAGNTASNAYESIFIGKVAGGDADNANNSIFLGTFAGISAVNANDSIFLGQNAGINDTVDNSLGGTSILIGKNTGTGGFSNSIGLGAGAVNNASNQLLVGRTYSNFSFRGVDYVFPSAQATTSGQVLTNDSLGNLTWATPGAGTDTNFATADLTATGNRLHNFANNSLTFNNVSLFQIGSSGGHNLSAGGLVDYVSGTGFKFLSPLMRVESLTPNTSGLRLVNLTSSSPVSTSTTKAIGVDALGNVVNIETTNLLNFSTTTNVLSNNVNGILATSSLASLLSPITVQNGNSLFATGLPNPAGVGATNAFESNFFGSNAGQNATDAYNSNFFGLNSGNSAANANSSNFFGESAGLNATNAFQSNFFGVYAGDGSTDAFQSNFFGFAAGESSPNAFQSNFFGTNAGGNAANAKNSIFIGGFGAGTSATNANNSIFLGNNAGNNDTVNNSTGGTSILIGDFTNTGGFSNSIAIGKNASNTKTNQFLVGPAYSDFSFRGVNYTFPSTQGATGTTLTNNGSGVLSWIASGSSISSSTIASNFGFIQNGNSFGTSTILGTNDLQDLSFETAGVTRGRFDVANSGQLLLTGGGAGARRLVLQSPTLNNYIQFSGSAGAVTVGASGKNFFAFDDSSNLFFQETSMNIGGLTQNFLRTNGNNIFNDWVSALGTTRVGSNVVGDFFVFDADGAGTYRMVIDSSGRTGLGVSAPTEKLDIAGNLKFSGALMPAGIAGATGTVLTSQGAGLAPIWSSLASSTTNSLNFSTTTNILSSSVNGILATSSLAGLTSPITLQNGSSLFSTGLPNTGLGSPAIRSIFLGEEAGNGATFVQDSNFFGSYAGKNAALARRANFYGSSAGENATNASDSNFFGSTAGTNATNAVASNFFGLEAGRNATNANNSNFFGGATGFGAANANSSNFFGLNAGANATDAFSSNFFGDNAGVNAINADNSLFMGSYAGQNAFLARNSIFLGKESGSNDSVNNSAADSSILIGDFTSTGGFSNSIAIGKNAVNTKINQFLVGPNYSDFSFRGINYTFPNVQGATGTTLVNDGSGVLSWATTTSAGWSLLGNAGTNPNTNFIGTTDANSLQFKVNNILAGSIQNVSKNIFFGENSGNAIASGSPGVANIGIGYQSMGTTTTNFGTNNIGLGYQTLFNSITSSNNSAIGYQSMLKSTSATNNVANGSFSLTNNVNGSNNVAIGFQSMANNISGSANTAGGYQSLFNSTGNQNTAFGFLSMFNNTSGNANSAFGRQALAGNTTGGNNTAMGYQAGLTQISGDNNIFVGQGTSVASTTASNQLSIGNLIYGTNLGLTTSKIGIGTNAPNNKLEITEGAPGNSGLRFTNLLSTSATTTSNGKVLTVNAVGDVILVDGGGAVSTSNGLNYAGGNVQLGGTLVQDTTINQGSNLLKLSGTFGEINFNSTSSNSLFTAKINSLTKNSIRIGSVGDLQTNGAAGIAWNNFGAQDTSAAILSIQNASNSTKVLVDSNGNVGIGTTVPATKLFVSDIADTRITVNSTGVATGTFTGFELRNGGTFRGGLFVGNSSPDRVDIWSGLGSPRMSILGSNGNVGIGTLTPGNKLEITKGVAGESGLRFTNLLSTSATTTANGKMLSVNSVGDVILVDSTIGAAGPTPLSGLTPAVAANTIDNTNFTQNWNWSTMTTQQAGLTLSANTLTSGTLNRLISSSAAIATAGADTGSLLDMRATGALTSFSGSLANISLTNTTGNTGNTGSLLNISDSGAANRTKLLTLTSLSNNNPNSILAVASLNAGSISSGIVRFDFLGAYNGDGVQVNSNTLIGNGLAINANSLTTGSGLVVSSNAAITGTAGLTNIRANNSAAGTLLNLSGTSLLSASGAGIRLSTNAAPGIFSNTSGPDLTTPAGNTLLLESGTTGSATFDSGTTGAVNIGTNANAKTVIIGNSTGATGLNLNSGTGLQLFTSLAATTNAFNFNANSITTANGLALSANSITTGSGLALTSSYAAGNSTNGLLYVANTSAITNGTIFRAQSNSTAGSGLTVLANGNVGVGTISPTQRLQVGDAVNTGNLLVFGTGTTCSIGNGTGATLCSSDERLKRDIATTTTMTDLEKIMQLRPVTYKWNTDLNRGEMEQLGLIAQEVEQVYPSFVSEVYDGMKGVDYAALVTPIIGAVQELAKKIENLAIKFTSKEIVAEEKLCIGSTCVNESQLQNLLLNQSSSAVNQNNPNPSDDSNNGNSLDGDGASTTVDVLDANASSTDPELDISTSTEIVP